MHTCRCAWDNGNFWVATTPAGIIHGLMIRESLSSLFLCNQPISLSKAIRWIIDYWNNVIDVVLKDGTPVESFPY